jgi:hypothetical protein
MCRGPEASGRSERQSVFIGVLGGGRLRAAEWLCRIGSQLVRRSGFWQSSSLFWTSSSPSLQRVLAGYSPNAWVSRFFWATWPAALSSDLSRRAPRLTFTPFRS